jgi:hypothetical protein
VDYQLVRGRVRDLRITKGRQDMSPFAHARGVAATLGVISTVMEDPAGQAEQASSRSNTEVNMEFFTCYVGKEALAGQFLHVGFIEGEEMEFVVVEENGICQVRGACSISQRLIWTLPYRTRGDAAQKWHDSMQSILISAIFSLLFTAFVCRDLRLKYIVRRSFYDFSFEATKIFDVFGFCDPEHVNLPKGHKNADIEYCKEKGLPRSPHRPFEFRYRAAGG